MHKKPRTQSSFRKKYMPKRGQTKEKLKKKKKENWNTPIINRTTSEPPWNPREKYELLTSQANFATWHPSAPISKRAKNYTFFLINFLELWFIISLSFDSLSHSLSLGKSPPTLRHVRPTRARGPGQKVVATWDWCEGFGILCIASFDGDGATSLGLGWLLQGNKALCNVLHFV